jgi:hypothetical protein
MKNLAIHVLVLWGFLGIHRVALAQVPAGCPNVCDQKYALCIAASCQRLLLEK